MSFDVINRSPAHIAIIHYQPQHDDCAVIKKDEVRLIFTPVDQPTNGPQIYLCDSGGEPPNYMHASGLFFTHYAIVSTIPRRDDGRYPHIRKWALHNYHSAA